MCNLIQINVNMPRALREMFRSLASSTRRSTASRSVAMESSGQRQRSPNASPAEPCEFLSFFFKIYQNIRLKMLYIMLYNM